MRSTCTDNNVSVIAEIKATFIEMNLGKLGMNFPFLTMDFKLSAFGERGSRHSGYQLAHLQNSPIPTPGWERPK